MPSIVSKAPSLITTNHRFFSCDNFSQRIDKSSFNLHWVILLQWISNDSLNLRNELLVFLNVWSIHLNCAHDKSSVMSSFMDCKWAPCKKSNPVSKNMYNVHPGPRIPPEPASLFFGLRKRAFCQKF